MPTRKVKPRAATKTQTDAPGITRLKHTKLPSAATATVVVSGRAARVGDLPVALSPVGPATAQEEQRAIRQRERAPASVRVRVLDQKATKAVGVAGALLALSRADGVDAPGRFRLRVDYRDFANAYGGDFAGRLRLVAMPACALTTPSDPTCRERRDLGAVRSGTTLSADVALTSAEATSLVALSSTTTSAGGTFRETGLSQAYSWSAGNQSGSFTYSYPLAVPPAGVGPQPSLAFTYDSGRVDGRTTAQNGQTSWVGEGWDLQVGYIERSYRPCEQDGSATYKDDFCQFSPHNGTIVFGGTASPLVYVGAGTGTGTQLYRSASDDGLRIEKLVDRTYISNGDNENEYWRVTTQDGIQYFFGVNKRYSNDNENTGSVQTMPVRGNNSGEPCYPNLCSQAYRWNLDYVLDPSGNSMTYVYVKESGTYGVSGGVDHQYDLASQLKFIDYGDRAGSEHSQSAPFRVEFETKERCLEEPCLDSFGVPIREKYPDTPWDLYCAIATAGCSNLSPTFLTKKRLYAVRTRVLDPGNPPQYRTVDEWKLEHTFPSTGDNMAPTGDDTSPHLWLNTIEHTGRGTDGTTITEPKMQFGGEMWGNRVDWGADIGVPPYMHYRLRSVKTSTGSETLVNYADTPEGGVRCQRTWTPIVDNNPYLCFPQRHYSDGGSGFAWFYKYLVGSVQERDLTGGSPDEFTFYKYSNDASSDSALWAHDMNETVELQYRSWSQWRGYSTVTATKEASQTVETVNRNVYFRGMDGDSKVDGPTGQSISWYGRNAGLLAPVGTPGLDGAIAGQGGKCLDIVGRYTTNGTLVHLYDCYDTWSQVWQRQPDRTIKNPQSGKCLDVKGYGTTNGSEITIYECRATTNQIWQPMPNGSLMNPQSGKCLDLSAYGTANATKVQLYTCTNAWNQVWQPQADETLRNPQPNRCIDLASSGTANLTVIQSRTCTGQPNQVWRLQSDGSLKNPASGRCLDIRGPSTTSGSVIHLYDCYNGWGQKWEPQADGSLKNPYSGKCLDSGSNQAGQAYNQLVLWDCNGSIVQKWTNRFNDADGLNGSLRESQDLDGTQIAASTIHVPTAVETGKRARPVTDGQDLYAYRVRETTTKDRTWIAADSTWRWTESRATYDSTYGLPLDTTDLGDTSVSTDDTCVRNEYSYNTAAYLVAYPYRTTEYGGTCGSTTVLAKSQTYYDLSTTLGTAPTKGWRTKTEAMTDTAGTLAVTEATFDQRGRPLTNKDARGHTTSTSYTPSDNLPVKEVKVSNPLGHSSTVTFETGRAQPTQVLDTNVKATITEYDALGRRTQVWLPSEKKSGGDPPSMKYAYDIRADAPSKLTVQTLQSKAAGTVPAVYLTSYQFLDGRMRVRNTQATAPGNSGRIITETSYDTRGQVAAQTAPYYDLNPAGSGLATADPVNLASRTTYSYDNLGRVTAEVLQAKAAEKWRTRHTYDGNRHTLIPPSGGQSTSYVDAAGRTTRVLVYPTAGTAETTTYGYNTAGELTTVTDAAGNVTRYGYDLAGNRTSVQDPDTGSSSSTYNAIGDLLSTTDARGKKISYRYDELGRLTGRWSGEVADSVKLATYVYDGINGAVGKLSSTVRHVGTTNYVVEPTGYDDRYRPTGTRWIIPQEEGKLAGTYATSYTYDAADHLTTLSYSPKGGLSIEDVKTEYDVNGYAKTLTGLNNYVTLTGYTQIGQLSSRTYGDAGPGQLIRSYEWEPATGRLSKIVATLPDPAVPDTRKTVQEDLYSYQAAGDISSVKDLTDGQSQCFRYDGLHRLKEAFTAIDDCAADPTDVGATGKQPYWDSYAFDSAGRRTSDTHRTGTATTSRTYNYPSVGSPQVHGMSSIAVTGSTTRTDSFGYEANGNLRTRTVAGVTTTYTSDVEGRFSTATVSGSGQTKHVYDADGGLLIRADPAGTALYLGGEELRLAGNNVTGTRYYTHNGAAVAVRTGSSSTVTWLAADHQNSASLSVDPVTGAVQRRWYTPYGADRAGATGWPTDRGFLNAPANSSTKLLDVGAREYDPDTGTFTAPDPLVDLGNPNSLNPYAYAYHNPITLSDPTGLSPGGLSNDDWKAIGFFAVTVVAAVVVCGITAGIGCAIMTGAAIGAGLGAAFAEDGKRFQGALIGGVAGAVGGAVGGGATALLTRVAGLAANATRQVVISGAAAGITESVANQSLATGHVDWRQVVLEGALGGALGLAGKVAGKSARKLTGGCKKHSFAPATLVLMADGSTKPIEEVENGDQVIATDPETGETQAQPVEQLHRNHDTELTDLTIRITDTTGEDGTTDTTSTTLHTTQNHPFWDQTLQQWVDAADLIPGHHLRTDDGDTATVTAVRSYLGGTTMHDLTVTETHTYYVIAGTEPVLVHNVNPGCYTSVFEFQLDSADWGKSRPTHFRRSAHALLKEMDADPNLEKFLAEVVGPGRRGETLRQQLEANPAKAPHGWVWQHATKAQGRGREGVMQLVPWSEHHSAASPFWKILHPLPHYGGGYAEWAIPNGAPSN
ncbi:ricin-type beta-trefoil lectin domain protein [Micromonospora sp. NPDC049497]|uniref:ricin-type beta-trefoil lectin domain protein n=1 Tax=Micromonospora sp. NPDC049497 TaxID=3364273 RepID=UPI00378CA7AD